MELTENRSARTLQIGAGYQAVFKGLLAMRNKNHLFFKKSSNPLIQTKILITRSTAIVEELDQSEEEEEEDTGGKAHKENISQDLQETPIINRQ